MEGPASDGFDFTAHMRHVCADIVARMPEFAHIDLDRVAIRWCQARRGTRYGIQASLTPMRFEQGATEMTRRGRRWTIQPVVDAEGREMLYLLSFYLPRFLNLAMEEKLATVCHELWHVSAAFDGDLRRHESQRYYAHGPCEKQFHAAMQAMARQWLDRSPPTWLFDPLRHNFRALHRRYGRVYGTCIPTPKLVPVTTTGSRLAAP
ncbi:MAG TPA: hypothetical protein VHV77_07785, partial [Pirellulales bacterium]|nr:hypothetical protein [Pirellulales bacterium]